MELEWISKQMI